MKMNIVLIVAGSILLIAGIVLTISHKDIEKQDAANVQNSIPSSAEDGESRPNQIRLDEASDRPVEGQASNNASNEVTSKSDTVSETDPKEIGNDFEGYIADMLKANSIVLKEWNQGTTSPEGAYAENELNPDFRVIQKSDRGSLEYWVECKYRTRLQREGFRLDDYQLKRYESIQRGSKRKIIIALGVGGSPKAPTNFYLIPLDTISRFKRIGHKFLPHYALENPRENFKSHMGDWFYNEVFKKNKN